jgi:hypothetical protein
MAVNISPVGGVAAQFFTSTGAVLTGGKLYTYLAGTTTPTPSYTTSTGNIAWTNPIILDAAGRVSGSGEIWITNGIVYKFVLRDSNDVLIATYDNVVGINDDTNVLAQLANTSNTALGDALVGFKQAYGSTVYPNAVAGTVHTKLQDFVSVKDFGALGNGTTNDLIAIQNANNAAASQGKALYFPSGVYGVNVTVSGASLNQTTSWFANNDATILRLDFGTTVASNTVQQFNQTGLVLRGLTFDGQVTTASTPTIPNNDPAIGTYVASGDSVSEAFWSKPYGVCLRGAQYAIIENCTFKNFIRAGLRIDNQFEATRQCTNIKISNCHVQRNRGVYGDGFYFGGVQNLSVTDCTSYDYQRIAFVLEFGSVTYGEVPGHVRYENCYAELGHDGIVPESNVGWWTEIGQDIVHTNCQVYSSGGGFLASGNFIGASQSFTSYHSYVNCSAIRVYRFFRLIGGLTNSTSVDIDNCFGQCIGGSTSPLAPTGSAITVGYGNGVWLQADTAAGASHTVTYNITNTKMEMIDFGALSPANTQWSALQVANTDPPLAATAKQFQVNISGFQSQWLTNTGATDTAALTVFETCTTGKFGDISVQGLYDYGGAIDARTRLQMNISNSANVSFGYIMGSFQMLATSELKINNTSVCLRKPTNGASDGYLFVSNSKLFDYRGDIRFPKGWWIDNCVIADANPSSIDRSTILIGLEPESTIPRKITNCEIQKQLRFDIEGGPTNTEYKLRLMFVNNRWYLPFTTESGLFLTQGAPLFAQIMMSNNAFMNDGTGSMAATASMIECNQISTSRILFTGAGNAFDSAMVTAGGHVVQVNTTPVYNDAPQTVAAPFNTVFGALVQFYPI